MAMAHTLPADPTLDEIRAALAPLIADVAAFDGFGDASLADAARRAGIDPDVAQLAFPGGARDMVDAWFADVDARMAAAWPAGVLPLAAVGLDAGAFGFAMAARGRFRAAMEPPERDGQVQGIGASASFCSLKRCGWPI